MNRFRIPQSLKCDLCDNIAVYDCKAINKKICRLCCDRYQLSDNSISECLKCNYLFREEEYQVSLNQGILFNHSYKDKFVFDSNYESLFLKTVELYERMGVNTINDMYNLAIQYSYVNRMQEAIVLYNKILSKNISKSVKSDVYEQIGDSFLRLQKVHEAREAYLKSVKYGNVRSQIYRRLGEVCSILTEFTKSIEYHEKALSIYFDFEWVDNREDYDFLYFTSYYSLAMGYTEIGNSDKAVKNAYLFLEYYGNFDSIQERYFTECNIIGDQFMPQSIVSMYKLISLNCIKLGDFVQAKDNIKNARTLLKQDVELAKIEGIIEGKLDSIELNNEIEKLRHSVVEKDRAIMILIENLKDRSVTSYSINIQEAYMGSKYNVENNGTIMNQAFGDNVTFNNGDIPIKEISTILDEIKNNRVILGSKNTQKNIENIEEDIRNRKFSGLKNQLTNLLVGITTNCVANNMGNIIAKLSDIISKLQ